MKHVFRTVIALALAALIALIGGFVYVVRAKYAQNDYLMQVGLALNAAMLVNAQETRTDAEGAVIAEYGDQRVVIVPENYRQLRSFLTRQAAMPLFGSVNQDGALHISLCGTSDMYIAPDDDGEGVSIEWLTGETRFYMHAAGGNHWQRLLDLCLSGTANQPNIAL